MSNYYNLLVDTFRNGGHKHIIHLSERLETIPPDLYLNICTGYYITHSSNKYQPEFLKRHSKKISKLEHTFKVFGQNALPLAYASKMIGQKHYQAIHKILEIYEEWILNYLTFKDEIVIKQLVDAEMEVAEENAVLSKEKKSGGILEDGEYDLEQNFDEFDLKEAKRQRMNPLQKKKRQENLKIGKKEGLKEERNCFYEEQEYPMIKEKRNCFYEEQEYPMKKEERNCFLEEQEVFGRRSFWRMAMLY